MHHWHLVYRNLNLFLRIRDPGSGSGIVSFRILLVSSNNAKISAVVIVSVPLVVRLNVFNKCACAMLLADEGVLCVSLMEKLDDVADGIDAGRPEGAAIGELDGCRPGARGCASASDSGSSRNAFICLSLSSHRISPSSHRFLIPVALPS